MIRREKWRLPLIWGEKVIKGYLRSSLIRKARNPKSSILSTLDIWSLYLGQKFHVWALALCKTCSFFYIYSPEILNLKKQNAYL